MASGYTSAWSKTGSFKVTLRCRWVSTFVPATRKSTITITPQLKTEVNYGNDYRLYSGGTSNCGIFGNGTNLWQFGSSASSGNYAKCGSAHSSYATFNKSASMTVTHNDDGYVGFSCGVYGAIQEMYSNKVVTGAGNRNGSSASVTNYSVIYHAKYIEELNVPVAAEITTATQTVSSQIPTLEGYTFLGWSTDPTATVPEFAPGDAFGALQNFDLLL